MTTSSPSLSALCRTMRWTAHFRAELCAAAAVITVCPAAGSPSLLMDGGLAGLQIPFVAVSRDGATADEYSARTPAGEVRVVPDGTVVYVDASPAGREVQVVRERFVGGRPTPRAGRLAVTRVSAFLGSDPRNWRSGLPAYRDLNLGEVWPGIEVQLVARGESVEKVFQVRPGAEVEPIRMRVDGVEEWRHGPDGTLFARVRGATVILSRPRAWQEGPVGRQSVAVAYTSAADEYGFALGEFDGSRPLFIDPILQSSYLGGSAEDRAYGVAVGTWDLPPPLDSAVYVTGTTLSSDLPTADPPGAQPARGGNRDVFVACLSSDLRELWSITYLGGSADDSPGGGAGGAPILVHAGKLYVTGETTSRDFPIPNTHPLRPALSGGSDAFVVRLNPDLWILERATFLGGTGNDFGVGLTGDPSTGRGQRVFVVGHTASTDFPGTARGYQFAHGSGFFDAFVARLDPGLEDEPGGAFRATYLGGDHLDKAYGVTIDPVSGQVFVVGETMSGNLRAGLSSTTPAPAQAALAGDADAFIAVFSPNLDLADNITYLGGSGSDSAAAVAFDPNRSSPGVLVAGTTGSPDFLTADLVAKAIQGTLRGTRDAFAARLEPDLSALRQATYLGGSNSDQAYAIALSTTRDFLYVAGETTSTDFPAIVGAAQPLNSGSGDAIVAKLDRGLAYLHQATYLGGTGQEMALGLAVHPATGDVYVTGLTSSMDLPAAAGGAQPVHTGGPPVFRRDGYVTRLDALLGTTAGAADVQLSWSFKDFGYQPVGTGTAFQLFVENVGTGPLVVSNVLISLPDFTLEWRSAPLVAPFEMAPGEQRLLWAGFEPVTSGFRASDIVLVSDDPDEPRATVRLEGVGLERSVFIETLGEGIGPVAIAASPDDRVHICYFVPGETGRDVRLIHATCARTGPDSYVVRHEWTSEILGTYPGPATDCRMAMAPDGTWHVAFVVGDALYYHRRGYAEPFQVTFPLLGEGVDDHCALAVDIEGVANLGYFRFSRYGGPSSGIRLDPIPYYAYVPLPDSLWVKKAVIPHGGMPGLPESDGARWAEIALERPALSHAWAAFTIGNDLVLYELDRETCRAGPCILPVGLAAYRTAVPPGSARLAWFAREDVDPLLAGLDPETGAVVLQAFHQGSDGLTYPGVAVWPTLEFLDRQRRVPPTDLHLAIQVQDSPADESVEMAYYDRRETALKLVEWYHARPREIGLCDPATGSCRHWVARQKTLLVDDDGDVGRGVDLADAGAGSPTHLAYLDTTHGTVKYARFVAPGLPEVRVSPSRWHFAGLDDWRAFFISVAGGESPVVLRRVSIDSTDPATAGFWRLVTDCDLEYGDPVGRDLFEVERGGFSVVSVEFHAPYSIPARAELVVETDAGIVRAELFHGLDAPDHRLRLTRPRSPEPGVFECDLVVPVGISCRVQWSPSLGQNDWQDLVTLTGEGTPQRIVDRGLSGRVQRFYRAVSP